LYELRLPIEIRARTLAIFDRTFAVTYVLEAVAVLIGLIGIGASMSTQVLTRRAEFGVLRHLGFTRRQIGASLAIEGAGLGCVGVICGVLAGVLISFILIHVVNRQSFHWSMDVHVPFAMMLTLCIALIAAAAASAVWSGRYAMSTNVIAAVKEDW
jgi:putative ABC transport system permease protein